MERLRRQGKICYVQHEKLEMIQHSILGAFPGPGLGHRLFVIGGVSSSFLSWTSK